MSSDWPWAWAAAAICSADWVLIERARSNPKSWPAGSCFDDAVGEEGERVAGAEGDGERGRFENGGHAEGQ